MVKIFALVYLSRVARAVRFDDALAIAERSAVENGKQGLTGMLLYTPSHFIQVLEGEEAMVRARFERICKDPRHSHVRILSERFVSERRFSAWSMKATMVNSPQAAEEFESLTGEAAYDLLASAAASLAK